MADDHLFIVGTSWRALGCGGFLQLSCRAVPLFWALSGACLSSPCTGSPLTLAHMAQRWVIIPTFLAHNLTRESNFLSVTSHLCKNLCGQRLELCCEQYWMSEIFCHCRGITIVMRDKSSESNHESKKKRNYQCMSPSNAILCCSALSFRRVCRCCWTTWKCLDSICLHPVQIAFWWSIQQSPRKYMGGSFTHLCLKQYQIECKLKWAQVQMFTAFLSCLA